jgi:hypothetical protein
MSRQVSPAKRQQIAEMYRRGMGPASIAVRLGLDRSRILEILRMIKPEERPGREYQSASIDQGNCARWIRKGAGRIR